MVIAEVHGDDLVIRLSVLDQVLAVHMGDVRVPLLSIESVQATRDIFSEVKGLRVGTGFPRVIALGRFYRGGAALLPWTREEAQRDFVAAFRDGEGWVATLQPGAGWSRLVLSGNPPEELARRVGDLRAKQE